MPKLNALYDLPCRNCDYLDYFDGYFCSKIDLPEEFWKKYLFQGMYLPGPEDLKACPYFIPRKTCIPSNKVKECQFWCKAGFHGNPKECPLWKLRLENN